MFTVACQLGAEPTDAQLRAVFEQRRVVLDELRRMFEEDLTRQRLAWVEAGDAAEARCGERRERGACLDPARWREYAVRLKAAGVERIETHETPGIYFHIHRTLPPSPFGWSGPYRYRGLVYAPGSPNVVHNHDDTEERVELGEGWYAYLIIDD